LTKIGPVAQILIRAKISPLVYIIYFIFILCSSQKIAKIIMSIYIKLISTLRKTWRQNVYNRSYL